jgi:hypothetical protein
MSTGPELDAASELAMKLAREHVARLGIGFHQAPAAIQEWYSFYKPAAEVIIETVGMAKALMKAQKKLAKDIEKVRKRQEQQDRVPAIFSPLHPSTNGHGHHSKAGA